MFAAATKCSFFEPLTSEFIAVYKDTSNATTYTFNSVSFGTPAIGDLVVVCVGADNEASGARTIASGTIGGISATVVATTNSNQPAAILIASGIVATSGTVEVTLSGSAQRCNIATYLIKNPTSLSAIDFDTEADSSTTDTAVLDISAAGVAISVGYSRTTSGNSFSWAISDGTIAENFDEVGAESSGRFSGATSNIQSTARTNTTITATHANSESSLVSASFK
jgi:hypothetical protein